MGGGIKVLGSPYPQENRDPIPAPVPTRPPAAPMQSPPIVPSGGTWNPDMGIKFGGVKGSNQGQAGSGQGTGTNQNQWPGQPGTWDPNNGFKFG